MESGIAMVVCHNASDLSAVSRFLSKTDVTTLNMVLF